MQGASTIRREISAAGSQSAVVVYFADGAKVIRLAPDAEFVIGRAYPADVVIADASLSRQHAKVGLHNETAWIEDLGSTNGTFVNGQRLERRQSIGAGDSVHLGEAVLVVHVPRTAHDQARAIEAHERFLALVEAEVSRSRAAGRAMSLALVRHTEGAHVSTWIDELSTHLRSVDRVGAYAKDEVLVLLADADRDAARGFARQWIGASGDVRVGHASFPMDGAHADTLLERVQAALQKTSAEHPEASAEEDREPASARDGIVSTAPAVREAYAMAERVATSELPVLILGETGTGKEVLSRFIHAKSERHRGPLRSVNCAAIPSTLLEATLFGHEKGAFTGAERSTKGLFEQASSGTILLDEVGELSAAAQAALLRVLETKQVVRIGSDRPIDVDARVLAATNRDLEAMAAEGKFRQDLLFRLNAIAIELPPLRARVEDIRPLAETFLKHAARNNRRHVTGIDADALTLLERYAWPGNVRELRNVVDRAVVLARGNKVTRAELPPRLLTTRETVAPPPPEFDDLTEDRGLDFKERVRLKVQAFETELIVEALRRHQGNQTQAAKALRLPVRTLAHKMQAYGIKKTFGSGEE